MATGSPFHCGCYRKILPKDTGLGKRPLYFPMNFRWFFFICLVDPFCPIYKAKGPLDDPQSYRGVVLLDTFGKKFHAWLRGRLVPILQSRRTPGQLGGLPSEQTLTGSHLLRVHGQLARAMKISSAVIFVDVRAAFHHMLRELIFLQGEPGLELDAVLDSNHFDLDALQALLHARCQANPNDFPEPLRRLANDVHRHTWFTQNGTSLGRHKVVATTRGTRPGSPVADVGFNLLMSDILADLHQRLQDDVDIAIHRQDFPVEIPPVTWVDDLAVPVTASHPAELIPNIRRVLQHIHQVFCSKGLQINYAKGKTETVVMFRGVDADAQRLAFFSTHHESYIAASTETHVFRVRAVASYKHLGVRFQMDSDLQHELQCRSSQARVAFNELRRPLFRNCAISIPARLQLLNSLVFSKLLYGAGTWYEVPRRVLQKLDSAVMRYYRSIVDNGFWKDGQSTDDALRAQHRLPTIRVLLAMARLRFLRHVASHDHGYHRDLLLEERKLSKGWLYEVEDDLRWMRSCVDLPLLPPTPDSDESWTDFFAWIRETQPRWTTWVRKALRMHHLRESMAGECIHFHQQIWTELRDGGAVLHDPVAEENGEGRHACPECLATFITPTAVAVHRAKKHGIHSPIKDYVQSEVCPGCLKHMWTSQRVVQHLRYRPNRCLDRIFANSQPKEYCNVELPIHLAKVKRLPASRQHSGPLLPLPHEKERTSLRARLRACEDYGAARDFWTPLSSNLQQMASHKLNAAVQQWYHEDTLDGDALLHTLVGAAEDLPFPHLLIEKSMIYWVTTEMWDCCGDWHPTALQILEDVHYPLLKDIPLWAHLAERTHLQKMLQSTDTPIDWDPVRPARVHHPQRQKRAQVVKTQYDGLEETERMWRHTVVATPPRMHIHPTLGSDVYYIVHLYSGRRREQDLQWFLERDFTQVNGIIRILSIDTAVHASCDVNQQHTWCMLCSLARSGKLLGLVLGPPCETWSSARHEQLRDENGCPIQGPRPLRAAARPWGLDSLRPKEYRQIEMGMRLLLRGLLLAIMTLKSGGAAILEHPAQPRQDDRASIWKTGVINILLQAGIFKKYTFAQWRLGGVGIKPTTLLYGNISRLPLLMRQFEDPSIPKPIESLVGRSSTGEFKTGRAKEYPPLMNQALSACIADRWLSVFPQKGSPERRPTEEDFTTFFNSLHLLCTEIPGHRSWLPDYQGH